MKKVIFQKTIIWMIIIFLLSSIFRLFFLDLIEFKSDEATTVYQTLLFFNHPYLIQRGLISGIGVYNFPLFNYLMIIFAIWSRDPQNLSWVIALINSFCVSGYYLLVRKYYDNMTAWVASLLLAFSPWGVIFSRKIWAQNLINIFLIPYLFVLHELIIFKNTKIVFPLFFLLTLLTQLHGSGLFLLVVTVLIIVILRVKINVSYAIAGILVGLIPTIPYIFFQINSNPQCPDCGTFLRYQESLRKIDLNNLFRPFQIISGLGYHFVLGKDYADLVSAYPIMNLLKYVFTSSALAILVGATYILIKRQKYLFLVIYFVTIPILYLITKTTAYMHYFVIVMPVSILLFALSIKFVFFQKNKYLKMFAFSYFVLLIISNIIFINVFYQFLASKKNIDGDYGPIYSLTKSFIERETREYNHLDYYPQLVDFAYIYAQSKDLHSKLGEFFLEKGASELAKKEINKEMKN